MLMQTYPLFDNTGLLLGHIQLENDALPRLIIQASKESTQVVLGGHYEVTYNGPTKFLSFNAGLDPTPAEPKPEEYWTVHGGYHGYRQFEKEEDAKTFYERVKRDDWSCISSLSHTEILETYRPPRPKPDLNGV